MRHRVVGKQSSRSPYVCISPGRGVTPCYLESLNRINRILSTWLRQPTQGIFNCAFVAHPFSQLPRAVSIFHDSTDRFLLCSTATAVQISLPMRPRLFVSIEHSQPYFVHPEIPGHCTYAPIAWTLPSTVLRTGFIMHLPPLRSDCKSCPSALCLPSARYHRAMACSLSAQACFHSTDRASLDAIIIAAAARFAHQALAQRNILGSSSHSSLVFQHVRARWGFSHQCGF